MTPDQQIRVSADELDALNMQPPPLTPIQETRRDELRIAPSARDHLERHGIIFDNWDIKDEEKDRISHTSVGIVAFRAPAFCIDMSQAFGKNMPSYIIALDETFLETGLITGPEQIGMILHEIGHIVNKPIPEPVACTDPAEYMTPLPSSLEEELDADYYTYHCGYNQHFANAMRKMRKEKIYGFNNPDIQRRLDELATPTKERLYLINIPSSNS